jgi:HAMP domain-containing protein
MKLGLALRGNLTGAIAFAGLACLFVMQTRLTRRVSTLEEDMRISQDDYDNLTGAVSRMEGQVTTTATAITEVIREQQALQAELERLNAATGPEVQLEPIINRLNAATAKLSAALPGEEPQPGDGEDGEPEPVEDTEDEDEPEEPEVAPEPTEEIPA